MDKYLKRQLAVLRQLITNYRSGEIRLNVLIQRIEGVSGAIGLQSWKNDVFPIILDLEQVNAAEFDTKKSMTSTDKEIVENSLKALEVLISQFQNRVV